MSVRLAGSCSAISWADDSVYIMTVSLQNYQLAINIQEQALLAGVFALYNYIVATSSDINSFCVLQIPNTLSLAYCHPIKLFFVYLHKPSVTNSLGMCTITSASKFSYIFGDRVTFVLHALSQNVWTTKAVPWGVYRDLNSSTPWRV